MPFKKYVLVFIVVCGTFGFSQQITLSPLSKISVLTVGPGTELYSKFGHSAIRIKDLTLGIDAVYNYGMFDFDTPNFYMKFSRGQLDYRLGRQRFDGFMSSYELENRWVREQVLNLSVTEMNAVFQFLENNYLPNNRYYKYDFFFDNCTTRIPSALKKVLNGKLHLDDQTLKKGETFRQLIHQNLEVNSWSNFGIDLALGSVIDKKGTPFLPVNVYEQLKHSTISGTALVYVDTELLKERPMEKKSNFFLSPLFWFSIMLLSILAMTFYDLKNDRRSRWLDFILFLISGAVGLLILLLWFVTDHQATKLNFNALWAFAPNMIVAFYLFRKTPPIWIKKYIFILFGLMGLTVILWIFQIQIFSPLIIFLLLGLSIRYLYLLRVVPNSEEKL